MHYSPALYLDPGSSSILIQLVVAALLGGGLFIRSQWKKIKKIFGKDTPETEEPNGNEEDSQIN